MNASRWVVPGGPPRSVHRSQFGHRAVARLGYDITTLAPPCLNEEMANACWPPFGQSRVRGWPFESSVMVTAHEFTNVTCPGTMVWPATMPGVASSAMAPARSTHAAIPERTLLPEKAIARLMRCPPCSMREDTLVGDRELRARVVWILRIAFLHGQGNGGPVPVVDLDSQAGRLRRVA